MKINLGKLALSPYVALAFTTAALSWGFFSKTSELSFTGGPDNKSNLSFEALSCGYLLIWEVIIYIIILRRILSYSREEELVIFRIREQYMRSKIEGKINENSDEYRSKLQEMRDVSQPKQIVYKIALSEYISFSLIPSIFLSIVLVVLTIGSQYTSSHNICGSLKTITTFYGILNSTVFISFRLNGHIPPSRLLFLMVVLFYALVSSVTKLRKIGSNIADFYHIYHTVLWSCIELISVWKFSQLPQFYGLRKVLFCSLR
jgi:hypothetical protein